LIKKLTANRLQQCKKRKPAAKQKRKKEYSKQLETKEWYSKRFEILERDRNTCQQCGCKKNLHVHHKWYEKGRMAWEYENDALITLCKPCHEKVHGRKF
jgi:5-methylcytosine-specific restriction endonuclease McrA